MVRVQKSDHPYLSVEPLFGKVWCASACCLCFQMCERHHRKRAYRCAVWLFGECLHGFREIQQLCRAEAEAAFCAKQFVNELVRSPRGGFIGQQRETRNGQAITVKNPIMVRVHPLGKGCLWIALDFNVQHDKNIHTAQQLYPHQTIGKAIAGFRVAGDLVEFLVGNRVARIPVDVLCCIGKKESHKLRKQRFQHILPRCVEFVVQCVACCLARRLVCCGCCCWSCLLFAVFAHSAK